jgi:hypothetical protein
MQLKAIIVQLEAENQLLKEFHSPDIDVVDDPSAWLLESEILISAPPGERMWDPEK